MTLVQIDLWHKKVGIQWPIPGPIFEWRNKKSTAAADSIIYLSMNDRSKVRDDIHFEATSN